MKQIFIIILCSTIVSFVFFWQTILKGLLPIPADALVGLYHPYRDYFASTNPQGVAYKNFILTDPVLQQYPWKWLAMQDWTRGKIPWNNPYSFSGAPLLANIQAGVFYPLNILFFMGTFHWMWTIFIILQPILAIIFMALWLRHNGFRLFSQIFGGVVWAFSSFNMVWMEWGNIGHTGLWLPLALLCVDNMKDKKLRMKNNMKWHALFQFSLISSLFAGHFQVMLYLLLAVILYWLVSLGISKLSVLYLIFHISFFIFLTSVQWIPSLQFTLSSNRGVEQENALHREGFFVEPKQFVQLVAPDFFGNPSTQNYRGAWNYAEQIIYIGIIPLLLSLFALISDGVGRRLKLFALVLVVIGVLFSFKNPISIVPYKFKIPIFSDFQQTRLSYLVTFGLSILATLGFQSLLRNPKRNIAHLVAITGAMGFALFAALVWSKHFDSIDRLISQRNLVFPAATVAIFFLFYVFPILIFKNRSYVTLFSVLCFLLSLFDLLRFGWKFTPFSPIQYLYPITPTIQFLQNNMNPDDRFMTLDRRILPPNANVMYHLASVNGYDPIYSKAYALKITEMESGKTEQKPANFGRIIVPMNYHARTVMSDLHVRYLLSLSELIDPGLTKVFQEGETRVYEFARG